MASIDAVTTWQHGGGTQSKTNAKRHNQTFAAWSEDHMDAVLAAGPTTAPASGSGQPLEETISWTKDGVSFETVVSVYGTQSELDDAVASMKAAIVARGGTII